MYLLFAHLCDDARLLCSMRVATLTSRETLAFGLTSYVFVFHQKRQRQTVMKQKLASTAAATRQVHRQRMGAIMGPTILFKALLPEDSSRVARLQKLKKLLGACEKATPKVKRLQTNAPEHISKYSLWIKVFCEELDKKGDENSYVHKHIFRKHLIAQAFWANGGSNKNAAAVEEGLRNLSSKFFLPDTITKSTLLQLLPDQGEYLGNISSVIRPWNLAKKLKTDPLLITCYACLSHDLLSQALKWSQPVAAEFIIQFARNHGEELLSAISEHKRQFTDGQVPIAPCIYNLLKPFLQGEISQPQPQLQLASSQEPPQKRPRKRWKQDALAGAGDAASEEET